MAKRKAVKRKPKPLTMGDLIGTVTFEGEFHRDQEWARLIETTESADARAICLALELLTREMFDLRRAMPDPKE